EDDVELVLLDSLLGGGAATRARNGRDRDRRGGLDVEDLFELLHELRELEEGHLLERVEQLVGAELRHDVCSSVMALLLSRSTTGVLSPRREPRPRRPRGPRRQGLRWSRRTPRAWRGARPREPPSAGEER